MAVRTARSWAADEIGRPSTKATRPPARTGAVASGPVCHGRAREACRVSNSVTGATALAPDAVQLRGQPSELPGLPVAPFACAVDSTSQMRRRRSPVGV
jgi:hypothetical protein